MSLGRDEHPDELISASLTGDLTSAERASLDAHLSSCARCRATLDAFASERHMIGGLRTEAPPTDLGARVRAGIESGGPVPWWRRPSTLVGGVATLATVTAALLAMVVLGNIPRGPIGATGSPEVSPSMLASAAASAAASEIPSASVAPSTAPLASIDPNPVGVMEYRLRDQEGSIAVSIDAAAQAVEVQRLGQPISAVLAPGGEWIAFQLLGDASGLVDTYAFRFSDGKLVSLFDEGGDSPFARLVWSDDGSLLAFTGVSPDGQSADAWIFNTAHGDAGALRLTGTGRTFVGDFHGGGDGNAWLWVSTAQDGQPSTDRLAVPIATTIGEPVDDPAADSLGHADGVFLPLHGELAGTPGGAIAWVGEMALDAGGWHFARGGMPRLYVPSLQGEYGFSPDAGDQLFDTLTIANGGEAFRSARFAWAPDGDGVAVWDAQWQGVPQPLGFPDQGRVYFGHPLSGVFIGPPQALDEADTAGGTVIGVSLAGGQYLALTVQTAAGSEAGTYGPTAEVRIITRNLGDTPDEIAVLADDGAWIGPAFYRHSLTAD